MPQIYALLTILPAIIALFGYGCVAVPVSKTKTFKFERHVRSIPEGIPSTTISRDQVRPIVSIDGNGGGISIGLAGSGVLREKTKDEYEVFSVQTQKRLAFGFFPSYAEDMYRPDRSIRPAIADCNAAEVFFGWPFATLYSLLAVPFSDDYAHSCHAWEDEGAYNNHIALLAGLSQSERTGLGMPPIVHRETLLHDPAHLSIFGFFKYLTFVVNVPVPSRTVTQQKESPFAVEAHGPYEVELSIPELGYRMRNKVVAGDVRTEFPIPMLDTPREVSANIRFLDPDGTFGPFAENTVSKDQKELFSMAKGRTFATKIALTANSSAVQSRNAVTIDLIARPKAHPVPFRLISKKHDGERSVIYKVKIEDSSKSPFEIESVVRPDIVEDLRETFQTSHPGIPADNIHAWAYYMFADGMLVYTGSAFAIRQTEVDDYFYDANTRKGHIEIHLGEGADADVARNWARDNISRIVRDKNVSVEVGFEASAGSSFRTLDERIQNDLLIIDFEATD